MKRCGRHVSTDNLGQNGECGTLMTDWWSIAGCVTFIKDGSVRQFRKVSQSWARASVLEYIIRRRISVPAYNIMIIHIWRAVLRRFVTDWWNVAAVSIFIKDGRVCDFYKFIQNCAFEKMRQNWAPLQCGGRVCQKCVSAALEKDRRNSSSGLSPYKSVSRLLAQVSPIRSYRAR